MKTPRHQCPDGMYRGMLIDAHEVTRPDGKRIQFTFRLMEGPARGKTFLRTTSTSMSEKSFRHQITKSLVKDSSDMFGEKPLEAVQLNELIGSEAVICIENERNKEGTIFSNIKYVLPTGVMK